MLEVLQELKWGSFTPTHLISLVFAILIPIGLYFLLRRFNSRIQLTVMLILSLLGPVALAVDIIAWGIPTTPLQYLPLHMCSFNFIFTPILILTRNKFLGNLLPLFSVGAALALIFNSIQAEYSIFSAVFWLYYLSHTMGASLPFVIFALGYVRPRPKYILPCVGATFGLYTIVHFANIAINAYLATTDLVDYLGVPITVNYMFSIHPQGNPLLSLFWSIIPYQYFYMFLCVPIVVAYFSLMNIGSIIAHFKKKRGERSEQAESQEALDADT